MDLEEIVKKELKKVIDSDIVEKKIENILTKTIEEAVESSLARYSDFGKALTKKFTEAFNADLDRISVPEYGTIMLSYITDEIDNHLKNETSKILKERIVEFFKPIEKQEYKVSEIVEMYKESITGRFMDDYDNIPEDHEFTAFVETSDTVGTGYFDLLLDSEPGKTRYQCEYQIRMNKDEGIWHVTHDENGKNFKLLKSRTHVLDTFERVMFQIYSQKIKIINDAESIDNYIPSSFD